MPSTSKRLDEWASLQNADLSNVLSQLKIVGNFGATSEPNPVETGRLIPADLFMEVLRAFGLWEPEQLVLTDSYTLTEGDSGKQIILASATPKTLTLPNLASFSAPVVNRGAAVWTLAGTLTAKSPSIRSNQGGRLEKIDTFWKFDNPDTAELALDTFSSSDLMTAYPEGYSRMRVANAGWPDNVGGTVETSRTGSVGLQRIQAVDGRIYTRTSIVVASVTQWNAWQRQALYSEIEGLGGPNISDNKLLEWFDEFYQKIRGNLPIGTATSYNSLFPDIVQTANLLWPDGSFGAYTLLTLDNFWEAETSWTITHAVSGKTVTQPLITINADTGIEAKPTPTIS